jgi:hypothetical protein
MSDWYSDEALAKQAEIKRRTATGEPITTDLMLGVLEPRVHASEGERCHCCGSDAREEVGGNGRHCGVCMGRGHDEESM